MSGSFEKCVKGATKLKLAPPKAKYIGPILQATHTGEAGVGEIFRTLQFRLRDSTWTIAFKALIVVHLMIRDGQPESTLQYMAATSPQKLLAVNNYTDLQTQGKNIRRYSKYLIERARAFSATKFDHVGGQLGRMKKITVDKGLLRESEIIHNQLHALVKCEFFAEEPENEITLTAFRSLVMDLLALFQMMNEAMINILEHYFEMSKPDAERALAIYKKFSTETANVVRFLSVARQVEHATRVEIPTIRHAPTSLSATLEEYLHDKDFETNRRQYLAEKDAKIRGGKPVERSIPTAASSTPSKAQFPSPKLTATTTAPKARARATSTDLIDFFDTIEDKQQTLGATPTQLYVPQFGASQGPTGTVSANPYQQQMQLQQQQMNPYAQFQQPQSPQQQQQQQQLNPQFTGAGFGGYGPQPQQSFPPQQQPLQTGFGTNPFGQVQIQPQQTYMQAQPTAQQTNPFRQSVMPTGQPNDIFGVPAQQQPVQQPTHLTASQTGHNPFARTQNNVPLNQPAPLLAQATGTNPFAKAQSPPPQPQGQASVLLSQATGSTNPFRQSTFVNQQTGQGWQQGPQFTMGGLEHLPTVPVFPRPGQQQQPQQQQPHQQQQQQQSPWG